MPFMFGGKSRKVLLILGVGFWISDLRVWVMYTFIRTEGLESNSVASILVHQYDDEFFFQFILWLSVSISSHFNAPRLITLWLGAALKATQWTPTLFGIGCGSSIRALIHPPAHPATWTTLTSASSATKQRVSCTCTHLRVIISVRWRSYPSTMTASLLGN